MFTDGRIFLLPDYEKCKILILKSKVIDKTHIKFHIVKYFIESNQRFQELMDSAKRLQNDLFPEAGNPADFDAYNYEPVHLYGRDVLADIWGNYIVSDAIIEEYGNFEKYLMEKLGASGFGEYVATQSDFTDDW